MNHAWVPKPVVLAVGRAWNWMMGRGTWTMVGDDISNCCCGKPRNERQDDDDE